MSAVPGVVLRPGDRTGDAVRAVPGTRLELAGGRIRLYRRSRLVHDLEARAVYPLQQNAGDALGSGSGTLPWPERELLVAGAGGAPVARFALTDWVPGLRQLQVLHPATVKAAASWTAGLPASIANAAGLRWHPNRPRSAGGSGKDTSAPPGKNTAAPSGKNTAAPSGKNTAAPPGRQARAAAPARAPVELSPMPGGPARRLVLSALLAAIALAATLVVGASRGSAPILAVSGVLSLALIVLVARPRALALRPSLQPRWSLPSGNRWVVRLIEEDLPEQRLADAEGDDHDGRCLWVRSSDRVHTVLAVRGPLAVRGFAVAGPAPGVLLLLAGPDVPLAAVDWRRWSEQDRRTLRARLAELHLHGSMRRDLDPGPFLEPVPPTGVPGDAPARTGLGLGALSLLAAGFTASVVHHGAALALAPFVLAGIVGLGLGGLALTQGRSGRSAGAAT